MDQGRSQAKRAEATRAEVTSTAHAEAASAIVAGRSAAEGEAVSPARDGRADAARPKQADKCWGKGKGETGTRFDHRNPKPPKNKATSDGVATSKAKPKAKASPGAAPASSKLDQLVALLRTPGGATLPKLRSATGWQVHSVRGAMAGALRRKGYSLTSEKPGGGLRRYRIAEAS